MWTAQHSAKVWIVAVSPDGALVAAGDYANAVVVYDAADGHVVWEKRTWSGKGAPFTWGLRFSGDSGSLAIGHWDSYAYVYDTASWRERAAIKRGDRVYSVALDKTGAHLAVGGRDKIAIVYALEDGRHGRGGAAAPAVEMEVAIGSFIYTIDLTPDARRLAIGTVDSCVYVYAVLGSAAGPSASAGKLLHVLNHDGGIQSVVWSRDASFLAVGGEEHAVTVWQLRQPETAAQADERVPTPSEPYIVLPRPSSVHSVAFSDVSLAFASGSLATVYGGPGDYGWSDRPSFEVIADVMDHPTALSALITQHATVLHSTSPMGGESLLQHTVRKRPAQKVEELLRTECRFGLISDVRGHTALAVALKNERKHIVRMLLSHIARSARDQPPALRQFMRHRAELASKYPDLFLEFIHSLELVREDRLAPQGGNIALLPPGMELFTAGSEHRYPAGLWADVMDVSPLMAQQSRNTAAGRAKRKTSVLCTDPSRPLEVPTRKDSGKSSLGHNPFAAAAKSGSGGGGEGGVSQVSRIDPRMLGVKKIEVVALFLPLEDAIAHVRLEDVSRPQNTLLFLLSTAAGELNDYSIFSTLTVRAMMQFKWHSYASYIFKLQFFGYLLLLGFVSVASFGLPRLCEDARTIEVCPVHLRDDEEEGYGAVPNRSPGYMFQSPLGVVTFVSLVFAALGSISGLALAMRQLVVDGSAAYFNSTFNCIDVIAYGSEILVVLLFRQRADGGRVARVGVGCAPLLHQDPRLRARLRQVGPARAHDRQDCRRHAAVLYGDGDHHLRLQHVLHRARRRRRAFVLLGLQHGPVPAGRARGRRPDERAADQTLDAALRVPHGDRLAHPAQPAHRHHEQHVRERARGRRARGRVREEPHHLRYRALHAARDHELDSDRREPPIPSLAAHVRPGYDARGRAKREGGSPRGADGQLRGTLVRVSLHHLVGVSGRNPRPVLVRGPGSGLRGPS